jgi:DtxR family Mn-dependent transcriptional regulator
MRAKVEKPLSESLEDYLEAIWHLQSGKRVARMRDIASKLGVKTPSVTSSVKKLARRGLVLHECYGYVILTAKGKRTARNIVERHEALENFLHRVLKVPARRAAEEACRIEHALSPATITRLRALTKRLLKNESSKRKGSGTKR